MSNKLRDRYEKLMDKLNAKEKARQEKVIEDYDRLMVHTAQGVLTIKENKDDLAWRLAKGKQTKEDEKAVGRAMELIDRLLKHDRFTMNDVISNLLEGNVQKEKIQEIDKIK